MLLTRAATVDWMGVAWALLALQITAMSSENCEVRRRAIHPAKTFGFIAAC